MVRSSSVLSFSPPDRSRVIEAGHTSLPQVLNYCCELHWSNICSTGEVSTRARMTSSPRSCRTSSIHLPAIGNGWERHGVQKKRVSEGYFLMEPIDRQDRKGEERCCGVLWSAWVKSSLTRGGGICSVNRRWSGREAFAGGGQGAGQHRT